MPVTQFSHSPMAAAIEGSIAYPMTPSLCGKRRHYAGRGERSATQRVDGFGSFFERAVHNVDASDRDAAEKMAAVDAGRSDDLVGAMLASQQASLSFSMLMQARNKDRRRHGRPDQAAAVGLPQ